MFFKKSFFPNDINIIKHEISIFIKNNSIELIFINKVSTDKDPVILDNISLSILTFLFRIIFVVNNSKKSKAKLIKRITSIYIFICFTKYILAVILCIFCRF